MTPADRPVTQDAESAWLGALAGCRPWSPKPGGLLVVSSHPDDEVLAAGGLIHTWASDGHDVTVVSVTDGEAAFPGWKGLDLVRRGELRGALRKLSTKHVALVRIGLPDGEVAFYRNRLRNALLTMMDPSLTLIAPYEGDGHPDHAAIGEVCSGLARSNGVEIARYPIWTWHRATPSALDLPRWVRFPLSPEARRAKARAVRCFESQLEPPRLAPTMPRDVLAHFERPFEAFLV